MTESIVAAGGFAPPAPLAYHTAWDLDATQLRHLFNPAFNVWTGHWFHDNAEAWAFTREKELRDQREAREAEHEVAVDEWPFEWPR